MSKGPANWISGVRAAGARLLGYTQEESAEAAGVTSRTVRNWERSEWWPRACSDAMGGLTVDLVGKARRTILRSLQEGDARVAMWVLERLDTKGFGAPAPLLGVDDQLTPEERASRFARVARAFGHELPPGGLEGVIDVSAVEDDD